MHCLHIFESRLVVREWKNIEEITKFARFARGEPALNALAIA